MSSVNSIIRIEIGNKQAMAKVVTDFLQMKAQLEDASLRAKEGAKHLSRDIIAGKGIQRNQ